MHSFMAFWMAFGFKIKDFFRDNQILMEKSISGSGITLDTITPYYNI